MRTANSLLHIKYTLWMYVVLMLKCLLAKLDCQVIQIDIPVLACPFTMLWLNLQEVKNTATWLPKW